MSSSSPSDLTLDYKPNGGGTYAGVPKQHAAAALIDGHHLTTTTAQATHKLREFLARLEEERLKIDAFKRELPLCMQLLNNAMEAYKQQLEAYQQMGSQQGAARPLVLEEFIPLKNIGIDAVIDKPGNPTSEKATWMESAQLWNGPPATETAAKGPQTPKERSEHPLPTTDTLDGQRNGGGAFVPFAKDKGAVPDAAAALPQLALAAAEVDRKPYLDAAGGQQSGGVLLDTRRDVQNGVKPASTAPAEGLQAAPAPPQANRKARRCWSPELHRRFVNALQILGGAQVATPKQIRELMKVDGLTNDEVKSHLQKYRLHTRRPPAPPTPATGAPQLVVLGGIWVPPEYAQQAAAPGMYGAHPATQAHYTAAQEYYPSHSHAAAVHHLQHHPAAAAMVVHHRAAGGVPPPPHSYRSAMAGSPPASEGRGSAGGAGGRDRSESIEEEGEGEEREDDDEEQEEEEMPAAAKADGDEAANKY